MRILFIGGTGIISSACTRRAVERGMDLTLVCRGKSARAVPKGVRVLHADIRQPASVLAAIGNERFDAVVNWIAFVPEHIEVDLGLFRKRTGQYVFISSASAYEKPPSHLPITESTPLSNPFWPYSRDKIACEAQLLSAYRDEGFPVTIVRPSHTYDATLLPSHGGWTVVHRMRQGKPVIVHGDGTSLWTLTHHDDFARAFLPLLGNPAAIGEAFQITSDESLTWNAIHQLLAEAAGVKAKIVHVPSDVIAHYDQAWGESLLGDKTHSVVFDNAKIKRLVPGFSAEIPFSKGAREIVSYYDADASRRAIDPVFDAMVERILRAADRALTEPGMGVTKLES
jgi:nucleoside-diphosphate-sugar epimerase